MGTPAARLEVVAGKAAGTSILVHEEMVLGRHADGAGRLAEDEEISRLHARLTLDSDGVCEIEDLGSTNGTYVNGLRISAPEQLSVGDMIELGQTTLAVRELPAPRRSSSKLFFPEEEFADEDEEEQAAAAPAAEPQSSSPAPFPAEPDADLYDDGVGEPPTAIEPGPVPELADPPVPEVAAAPVPEVAAAPEPEVVAAPEPEAAPAPEPEGASAAVPEVPPAAVPEVASAPEPVGEVAPGGEPTGESAPPPLNLQLEVDFVRREAQVSLDRGSEAVRLTFEDGVWRIAPPSPPEEGDAS